MRPDELANQTINMIRNGAKHEEVRQWLLKEIKDMLAYDCRGFTHCCLIKGARMSPNDEDDGCAPEDESHGTA